MTTLLLLNCFTHFPNQDILQRETRIGRNRLRWGKNQADVKKAKNNASSTPHAWFHDRMNPWWYDDSDDASGWWKLPASGWWTLPAPTLRYSHWLIGIPVLEEAWRTDGRTLLYRRGEDAMFSVQYQGKIEVYDICLISTKDLGKTRRFVFCLRIQ